MPATSITNPVSGESLVGTEPQLLQQVDPGWRHRLNLYTGRALTDTALDSEQAYRGGLLATLGQSVTAGTVTGLALTLDTSGIQPVIAISPGYGISASGQDVVLNSALKTRLNTLSVIDGVTGNALVDPATGNPVTIQGFAGQPGNSAYAGILLLQPVIAQVSGQQLDTGSGAIVVSGNLGASCDQDPAEYAFEDWQIADAVRLVFLPWPVNVPALALPPLNPPATWRNRLAYAIFEAEALLGADDQLPWSMLGVPVALIAGAPGTVWKAGTAVIAGQFFTDANGNLQQAQTAGTSGSAAPSQWNAAYGATTTDGGVAWVNSGPGLFVDCSAVVRAGGLPRTRYILPSQPAPLSQWQPGTPFIAGSFILDSNNHVQVVQTAGTTAATSPTWNTTFGHTTSDGSVVWIDKGPASWQPGKPFAAGQFLYDSSGNIQQVVTAGTSGNTQPDWNGIYLPTEDGSVTWINNGSGNPPIIQPGLAQARINQLSEQLSQILAQRGQLANLSQFFATLPPSGILPASSLNFATQQAPWFPPNWSVSVAPVYLEELETVLETGMLEALIAAESAAPSDQTLLEPVEVLVPLPDSVYDPDILVKETVAPIFQQEVDQATEERNLTLQQLETVIQELNILYAASGPNTPTNPNLIDPDAGLTADEIAGRDTPPPYTPAANETFGTLLESTWQPSTAYTAGQFAIDGNGTTQIVVTAGTSGGSEPDWNTNTGVTTADGPVVWLNNGPWGWQPGTAYVAGQFVIDPAGFMQTVGAAGTSAASPPSWNETKGQTTPDGIVWLAGGNSPWQADTAYSAGQLILDSAGNIQIVQTAGISGDSAPAWNPNPNQTTQDSGVTWNNLGHSAWQKNTVFLAGQAILDSAGKIQTVAVGGTSGAQAPTFNDAANATTIDAAVKWTNNGPLTWQANTAYAAGQIILDSNGALQHAQAAGTSGAAAPAWNTTPEGATVDGTVTWTYLSFYSTDLVQLKTVAGQAPYTITYTDGLGTSHTIPLISDDDFTDLDNNGLPHFIARLNAKISQANDLLDTAFLTSQTDIYRYRQYVLGSSAATSLATSPILANIATGETATATAANLQDYVNTLIPPAGSTTPAPTYTAPFFNAVKIPVVFTDSAVSAKVATGAVPAFAARSMAIAMNVAKAPATTTDFAASINKTAVTGTAIDQNTLAARAAGFQISKSAYSNVQAATTGVAQISPGELGAFKGATFTSPSQIIAPGQNTAATTTDITSQSPLAGAQANIRTLTIAERLQQSPSQEAMFYSISNRLSFLQLLQMLETDLELVADDLPILVDGPPAATTTTTPAAVPVVTHTFSEWLNGNNQPAVLSAIQNPYLIADSSEATVFSVGVRVAEQHVMLLRALEARVQQYVDFVGLCTTALNNIQNDAQQATVYLTQLRNNLLQDRQNVAFTTSLLADETQRVAGVNAQRLQILQSSVQLVAYTRARTLAATSTAPSRQLVPANVASPVPACLQQSVSIPPELREIVGLLREAPVTWLPSAASQVKNLDRPPLLQQLALSTQARAVQQLALPLLPSSAAGEPGVYAPAIANIYSANQQVFRNFQTQRTAFQPSALTNLSWSVQVAAVQGVAAVNDLISSDSVHTEVTNAVSRLIQQISSVSTCLYTRAGIELPIDRLAWAEFLRGAGASVQLQSLAVLPNWNQLAYTDRQQMQLLVDWLFLQIDTTNSSATAFMSDVVRTAILLASDVPLDNIIPGNIVLRTQPAVGGVVSLNLPSDRIASGMFVNLYSGASLAARGVVSDLDSKSVTATVTDVFTPGVYLEASDIAHFTALTPQAVALRPLFMQS